MIEFELNLTIISLMREMAVSHTLEQESSTFFAEGQISTVESLAGRTDIICGCILKSIFRYWHKSHAYETFIYVQYIYYLILPSLFYV